MRVVIVGATGNTGTALLRALADEPDVTSVVGIARRLPDRDAPPYSTAEWVTADISSTEPDDVVVGRLAEAFRGADAVVHLAWLIQPNRDRDLLRRTNVEGTRRVAEAVVRAGVPQLVVASSIGAYSPVDDDTPRTEDWPTRGIPTSHYSVDKAAQERILDEIVTAHPEVAVARVRPSLVFQALAGAEVSRLFVNAVLPRALKLGMPPVLPLPAGLRVQAVHAHDLADAYRRVVLTRARGAFNIAADDLLSVQDLADIADHGHHVAVPPKIVRAAVLLAWRSHLVAADPGWLDMAMGAPVLDTTKARTELGWRPVHTAAQALQEILAGMRSGLGAGSAPLRPAATRPRGNAVLPLRHSVDAAIPESMDRAVFGLYLSDHLTGATAGLERLERMAGAMADEPFHAELTELVEQVRAERELYADLLEMLQVPRRPYRQAAAWVAERAGRLKLNGRLFAESPMTPLLEAELMRAAVIAKMGGWSTLREHAPDLGLDPAQFDELIASAQGQLDVLDRLHAHVRATAFRVGSSAD